jgi:phosphoglucosamine mutase
VSAGKPLEDAAVQQAIAEAEAQLAKNGRLLIRPSGTEPLIRVMAEGDDRGQVERIVDELVNVIGGVRNAA